MPRWNLRRKNAKVLRVLLVSSCILTPFSLTCFSVSCLALRAEKQKLSESIDEMKALVRSSHNKAVEVITHAE